MNLFLKGEIMSMAQLKYKRVLLKISGEALAGDKHFGFDFDVVSKVCDVIKKCTDMGVQMGVVIGGGNFWRGVKNGEGYIERTRADHMGMLATAMNCMAVADVLEQKGVDVRVQTALEIKEVAEPYIRARAIRHLEKGRVVLFGCGIGSPFFSTDTAAVLRAAEINADVILLAKNIDGVYNADPAKDANAIKYDAISYEDVLAMAPQVIVLPAGAEYTVQDVVENPQLSALPAVQDGAVYQMPGGIEEWDSPVPSGILGTMWMTSVLHPDVYPFEEFTADAQDFYQTFYGFSVDASLITK